MRTHLVLVVIVSLVGCGERAPPAASPPAASVSALPTRPLRARDPSDEEECAARGGKMERVCLAGDLMCVLRHRDAGKRCTKKSDCIGDCLYEGPPPAPPNPVGKCAPTDDPCGCVSKIVGGYATPKICMD